MLAEEEISRHAEWQDIPIMRVYTGDGHPVRLGVATVGSSVLRRKIVVIHSIDDHPSDELWTEIAADVLETDGVNLASRDEVQRWLDAHVRHVPRSSSWFL